MWLLNQIALDGFCVKSDTSRKHRYASRSERVKRFCQKPSTGFEERFCSNNIFSVFMERNISVPYFL
jgi:hypothetical protein